MEYLESLVQAAVAAVRSPADQHPSRTCFEELVINSEASEQCDLINSMSCMARSRFFRLLKWQLRSRKYYANKTSIAFLGLQNTILDVQIHPNYRLPLPEIFTTIT